jgi:hypothetical protein
MQNFAGSTSQLRTGLNSPPHAVVRGRIGASPLVTEWGEGEKPMLTGGGLTVLARSEGPQRNNNFEVVLVTASTSYYYY